MWQLNVGCQCNHFSLHKIFYVKPMRINKEATLSQPCHSVSSGHPTQINYYLVSIW